MSKLKKDTMQVVNFRISDDELEDLDNLAGVLSLTRSQLIRDFVVVGLEEAKIYHGAGMSRSMITVRDLCQWMIHKAAFLEEKAPSQEDES